jgi:parallel beta-helix repeat protein
MKSNVIKIGLIIIISILIMVQNTNSFEININDICIKLTNSYLNGTILYVGGIGEDNYTRIKDAIKDAKPGDTVFVYNESSPYYEQIFIDKSINLIGEDKNSTIIDSKKIGSVVRISADNVNITGFTIRNSGDALVYAGVKAVSDYNTIYGNIFSYNDYGICLEWSSYNKIFNNIIIKNSEHGIFLYQANDNIVKNNYIENCNDYGIYLFLKSKNNLISGNIIRDCYDGINSEDSSSNIYLNNTISNCDKGIWGSSSAKNRIEGNDISYCDDGIWLAEYSKSIITKNIITNNNQGIFIKSSSNRNVISYNIIRNNVKGLYFWYSSDDNEIIYNTFISNVRNVFFADSFNNWSQNYWDRPRFFPKLIVGGKTVSAYVYLMPWLSIDWRPAKEPYDI